MSLVTSKDILHCTALSGLTVSPGGTRVLYRTHRPDLEINGYQQQLWQRVNDAPPQPLDLPMSGDPIWLDESRMLHAAPLPDGTGICRTDLAHDHRETLFTVPFPAALIAQTGENAYLLRGMVDLRERELLSGKQGEALEQARRELEEERSDCMVMDEFPYWANGAGMTNKKRSCLFLWQDGVLIQLTGNDFTVGSAAWCPACRRVFFAGAGFTVLRPFFLGLWSLDLETMECHALVPEGKYLVSNVALAGGKVIVTASLQEDNPAAKTTDLYTLDPENGTMQLLCGGGLSFGNTVMTDCRFTGGREFAVWEDKLYFLATVDEYAHLLCCDLSGMLTTIVGGKSCVDDFALSAGGVYFVGLQGQRPHELYFQSWDSEAQLISDCNGDFFREKELAQPCPVSFVNENGNEIRGFVLTPMADTLVQQGRYPAILDIHGGPLGAYGPVYFHEMQYWVAHGYYVMFCNPTGSTGRGQDFCDICGDSGGTDYRDLMVFVDTVLARYPAIDPARLGVTGGSYGGFMTNWVIGHTGRFAAACAQRSTANNISNEAAADGAPLFLKSNLKPGESRTDERLWEQSPLKYIDNAVTPTLFLHSLEDYCCYHAESIQMYAGLQRLGVPTRMVLFKGEHHGLSRCGSPRNRLRRLREITDWMDRWLVGDKEGNGHDV